MKPISESISNTSRAINGSCDCEIEQPVHQVDDSHQSEIPSVVSLVGVPDMEGIDDSKLSSSSNLVVPEDADAQMARLMAQLSMHEREEVYNDLHGVADEIVETPEMIDEAIGRMKLELSKMSTEAGAAAYQQALTQDSSFVYEYKSLQCFLRAERFDAARAAIRLTNFYSFKSAGFGVEKLTKDIYQEDLTQSERDGMYDSMTLLLPFRDRGGRSVFVKVVALPLPSDPPQELIRRGFYANLSHSRDEENQRKGLSCVVYMTGDDLGPKQTQEIQTHF